MRIGGFLPAAILRRWRIACVVLLALALPFGSVADAPPVPGATPHVTVLTIDGVIGPATADYAVRGIARAERSGSRLVILVLDTPGGLDTAMRSVIKAILASAVPVATYVAPSGARAASAGTYILYASHIAAMAPGTNLGAATPVRISGESEPEPGGASQQGRPKAGGVKGNEPPNESKGRESAMTRKQVNDAAAYIRGLAQLRGRNADWAERAVREAVSLSADDALRLHVIDVIAPDVATLAARVDGKTVNLHGADMRLKTTSAAFDHADPDWRTQLLAVITNPSLALLLMTVGVYGLIFEFMSPGAVAPAVVGGICLLLGLYGVQLLPVNYAGLALVLLALGCMAAEAFLPSHGVLGAGGTIAFVAGALILIDTDQPGFGVPLPL
ncbi:nodulation protein NfeD, partial [Oxalobacteraceae bacterium OM1]